MGSLLDETITWSEFGRQHLDPRVSKALTWTLKLERPTLVQSQGIPVALEGKDLLCRARTGSGKTLCYAVPMVQRLLTAAEAKGAASPMGGVVLVPTKELVAQVHMVVTQVLAFCYDVLTAETLLAGGEYAKAELPTILVTTPASLVALAKKRKSTMKPLSESLKILVIDEADLMFSFGYEDDMQELCSLLPSTYQAMLVSATLSEEVEKLKGLMLHKPVLLKLEEPRVTGKLTQFYMQVKPDDKYLVLYTLLKLNLLQGKKLIFVKNVESAYRLKIFLERFSIASSVLNAQLPHGSRQNIIESFNQSVIDLLIATDAGVAGKNPAEQLQPAAEELGDEEDEVEEEEEAAPKKKKRKLKRKAAEEEAPEAEEEAPPKKKRKGKKAAAKAAAEAAAEEAGEEEAGAPPKKKRKKGKAAAEEEQAKEETIDETEQLDAGKAGKAKAVVQRPRQFGSKKKREVDEHYSITRGVDLHGVTTVINADMPETVRDYVHRVGRCARGGASGTALTICDDSEELMMDKLIRSQQEAGGVSELRPLPMQMSDAERFRYRVTDQSYRLNKKNVMNYMARELQKEALNSEKLQEYFQQNPEEKKALQEAQRKLKENKATLAHLQAIPEYLVPEIYANNTPVQQAIREEAAAKGEVIRPGMKKKRFMQAMRLDPLQNASEETEKAPKKKPWINRLSMMRRERRMEAEGEVNPNMLPPLSRSGIEKYRKGKKAANMLSVLGEAHKTPRHITSAKRKMAQGRGI